MSLLTGGVYLALEGPDGCGKSTQARRLGARLQRSGREVVHVREPGSTAVGESLRRLLLDPATGDLPAGCEALLFSAARAEMLRAEVAPALERHAVVLAERCYLSTFVYQGRAADAPVPLRVLRSITDYVVGERRPQCIIVLDVPAKITAARLGAGDRIEAKGLAFHQRVCDAYRELAGADERCVVADGTGTPDDVEAAVWGAAAGCLQQAEIR